MKRVLALAAALTLSTPAASQMRARTAAYDAAKALYVARDYTRAFPALQALRDGPYGRHPQIDFMLGTSACQTARRSYGRQVLANMLVRYTIKKSDRTAIRQQIERCAGGSTVVMVLSAGVPTTSGGFGKTFHWVDSKLPVASYPAFRIRDLDPALLAGRLVPRTDRAGIVAALRARDCDPVVGTYIALCKGDTAIGRDRLDAMAREADGFIAFLKTEFGIEPADEFVTVRLTQYVSGVRKAATELHGLQVSPATIAYSYQDDLSLVAVTQGGSGSILHELVHLALRRKFGDAPQWLEEGLASLYEVSVECGGKFYGIDNWRGQLLRRSWPAAPAIDQIATGGWFEVLNDTSAGSAESVGAMMGSEERRAEIEAKMRYLVLRAQDRGTLAAVYRKMGALPADADIATATRTALASTFSGAPGAWDAELKAFVIAARSTEPRDRICAEKATIIRKDLPLEP